MFPWQVALIFQYFSVKVNTDMKADSFKKDQKVIDLWSWKCTLLTISGPVVWWIDGHQNLNMQLLNTVYQS